MPLSYKKKNGGGGGNDKDRNNNHTTGRHQRKTRNGGDKSSSSWSLSSRFTASLSLTGDEDDLAPPAGDGNQPLEGTSSTASSLPTTPSTTTTTTTDPSLPYTVAHSPVYGRYLVAARDLAAGATVCQQPPLCIGPCAEPVCLGCYAPLSVATPAQRAKQYKCPGCGWPMCAPTCAGLRRPHGHSTWECSALRERRVADRLERCTLAELEHAYEAIAVLRTLLLRKWAPEGAAWRAVAAMESHDALRRECAALWQRNERVIVQRLRDQWGFGAEFSAEEVHRVCGVWEVNCFEVGHEGEQGKARALYDVAYLLAHDCAANTAHSDALGTFEMQVRVVRPVRRGEAITLSYAYTLQGTFKRREHLHECKFFWCACARCSDPTELGTYSSAIICPKCTTAAAGKTGLIVSSAPLDQHAVWRCQTCAYELSAASQLRLIDRVYAELEAIDANDVRAFEEFLRKYRNVFHSAHYLCVCAKHSLFQLYGRADGYLIHELTLEQLRTKEQYCRDLLAVCDRLEPGDSKLRGTIMYELHAPIMLQATRRFEKRELSAAELKRRLAEVVELLGASERILGREPVGTGEYEMSLAAADALQRIGHV